MAISIAISILFPSTWQWLSIIDCNIERHVLPITAASSTTIPISALRTDKFTITIPSNFLLRVVVEKLKKLMVLTSNDR